MDIIVPGAPRWESVVKSVELFCCGHISFLIFIFVLRVIPLSGLSVAGQWLGKVAKIGVCSEELLVRSYWVRVFKFPVH